MEVLEIMLLMIIVAELALIYSRLTEDKKKEIEETKKTRRDTQGVFSNPLGDSYRKNKGLYVPIKPGSVMLDGDEEDEDEV